MNNEGNKERWREIILPLYLGTKNDGRLLFLNIDSMCGIWITTRLQKFKGRIPIGMILHEFLNGESIIILLIPCLMLNKEKSFHTSSIYTNLSLLFCWFCFLSRTFTNTCLKGTFIDTCLSRLQMLWSKPEGEIFLLPTIVPSELLMLQRPISHFSMM